MDLTDSDVRAILQLLDASAFDELELETDAFKLTLRRADGGGWSREDSVLRSARVLQAAAAPAAADLDSDAATGSILEAGAVTQAGTAARLSPGAAAAAVQTGAAAGPAPYETSAAAVEPGAAANLSPGAATAAAAQPGPTPVHSPLPGTFYRSPKPGAPPFVEIGTQVEPETVIAILETMKLMNSIRAGTPGRIVEICAADGQLVAQHQVLARIRRETA
jgi:acetyl-CoA carboxylase biotin carboxyl carrier protein